MWEKTKLMRISEIMADKKRERERERENVENCSYLGYITINYARYTSKIKSTLQYQKQVSSR